jgi:predicted dehydrogenase
VPTEAIEPVYVLSVDKEGLRIESTHLCSTEDPSGWFGAVKAFVTAVLEKQPSPCPGSDGRAALAAVLAAHQSVVEKKVIHLG